jgi:hypothetical protein
MEDDENTAFFQSTYPLRLMTLRQQHSRLLQILEALILMSFGGICASLLIWFFSSASVLPTRQNHKVHRLSTKSLIPQCKADASLSKTIPRLTFAVPQTVKTLAHEDKFWRIDAIGQQAWDTLVPIK